MAIHKNNPPIVTNGLQIYLDASNRKSYTGSGTTWVDLSGRGNNGTLTNGPTFNNRTFTFDGTNHYGEISNNPILVTNNLTVSIWCKPAVLGVFKTPLTSEPISASSLNGYGFRQRTDNTWWWTIGKEGLGTPLSVGIDNSNIWVNLIGTYNGTIQQLYKNGLFINSRGETKIVNFTNEIRIGSLVSGGDRFQGDISNIQIYNRVLSASEVQQNYNATKSRFGI